MHNEAMQWARRYAIRVYGDNHTSVLDIGGRDINGTVKVLFPGADFTTLDIHPGENVDIVANAAHWEPDREYDIVTCTEVFEHASEWRGICATAFTALRSGGYLIATCAGPGRALHSGIDGGAELHEGEFYENVSAEDLHSCLKSLGFVDIETEQSGCHPMDTRAFAMKP